MVFSIKKSSKVARKSAAKITKKCSKVARKSAAKLHEKVQQSCTKKSSKVARKSPAKIAKKSSKVARKLQHSHLKNNFNNYSSHSIKFKALMQKFLSKHYHPKISSSIKQLLA
jgi:hypothetical protein